jgi:hypothetical protein
MQSSTFRDSPVVADRSSPLIFLHPFRCRKREEIEAIMKWFPLALRPLLGVALAVGVLGMVGCSPEGAGSAPKLKGSKDEIQKATQSGIPGQGTQGGNVAPGRAGRRVD